MMLKAIAVKWIVWRHGRVFAIKPPIGFPPWNRPEWWHPKRIAYMLKMLVWRFEDGLHQRYGQGIRDSWLKGQADGKDQGTNAQTG